MMKRVFVFLLAVCSLFYLSVAAAIAADPLFIQPFQAKIYAQPSIASEVLGQVDSGFEFVSAGKEGRWVKLVFKGKPGFVPAVQTALSPPVGKGSVKQADPPVKLGARARTSSSSAVVAGMKGLTYEDRARVSRGEVNDYDALDKIEALKVTPEELKQFQLEGGSR